MGLRHQSRLARVKSPVDGCRSVVSGLRREPTRSLREVRQRLGWSVVTVVTCAYAATSKENGNSKRGTHVWFGASWMSSTTFTTQQAGSQGARPSSNDELTRCRKTGHNLPTRVEEMVDAIHSRMAGASLRRSGSRRGSQR